MQAKPNPRLERLREAGVSIWLDTLSRELLESGEFGELVRDYHVSGATSNPTIFAKAITGSARYDEQLRSLGSNGSPDARELFFAIALDDVRAAAAILRPVHERTGGGDGFVSFECTPDLADDGEGTIAQALYLWRRLALPNTLIKVPATAAGVAAIEELTARGVNVNVTLLFSVERYEQVIEAYLRGLEQRVQAGRSLAGIRSVASFFVSRVDAKADARLPADSPFRGHVGIANAQAAYDRYRAAFSGERWQRLLDLGAAPQRPLWASSRPEGPLLPRRLLPREPGPARLDPDGPRADPGRIRGPRGAPTCGRDFRDGRRRSTRDHGRARAGGRRRVLRRIPRASWLHQGARASSASRAGRLPALSR
jgi:transaldolase